MEWDLWAEQRSQRALGYAATAASTIRVNCRPRYRGATQQPRHYYEAGALAVEEWRALCSIPECVALQ